MKLPADIDPNIRQLVEALNRFQGIKTIGSCGGHPEPRRGGQWPDRSWYVKFKVAQTAHGWRALEFLAWLVNHDYARGYPDDQLLLYPDALPPYLNKPGQMLTFVLETHGGADSQKLAEWVDKMRNDAYVAPPGKARK